MQTRFPQTLYDDYKKASIKHGLEMSEIANRAIRKFRNSGLDVATLPDLKSATTNPITIRLQYDVSPENFKKILAWYLPQYKDKKAPAPIVIEEKDVTGLYAISNGNEIAETLNDSRIKILHTIDNY